MKLKNLEGQEGKEVKLPRQFTESFRPDLIKRAVLSIQGNRRQKYGAKPGAGQRPSAYLSKRRKSYRTCYGKGISRTPRKILSRRGLNFYFVGAVAPNTVGGRRAHAPKAEKNWGLKMNHKERRLAIRSAIAVTMNPERVKKRGHKTESFVVDTGIENLKKTKEVRDTLLKLGLAEELKRSAIKKVRAGKGKRRGRKYRFKKGPLVVVSKRCSLYEAARNIPGVDVCIVNNLNAELLAPGTDAARLTLWSEAALQVMEKGNLFYNKRSKK
jgi:large subunit ribosomal protein L4e